MQNKSKYWVYAIESEISGRIYIGQTSDLDDRLKRHNSGEVYSTKAQRPWILVVYEEYSSRSQAMWKESELKKSKGKRFLKR
jgi:putative endonuclease